ncbi:hypothetical protein ACX40Y_01330 [Sphingomonas sp. RS6]
MSSAPTPPIDHVCERCGCNGVTRDAWAEWDVTTQRWLLGEIFDYSFCHQCHRETRLLAVPLGSGRRGE